MLQPKTFRLLSLLAIIGATSTLNSCLAQTPPVLTDPVTATAGAATTDDGSAPVAPLPVQVAPDSASLHYSGRFDLTSPARALCSWPASAVTLRFRGSAVNANLGLGANRFTVVLDGKILKKLTGKASDSHESPEMRLYSLASGLANTEHTVILWKNTETNVGDAAFGGFQLSQDATPLAAPTYKRKIEVIGDSISAGYGNEGANQNEHFSPATENSFFTYGAIAARQLGADYTCIAWSGRTMWPTFTIPEIYNRTLPRVATPIWQGDAQTPDVYLINLATNEFGRAENPEEEGWVKAYRDFIGQLRQKAPNATIYCALSPMMNDDWPPQRKARSTARNYLQRIVSESNAAGDTKVRYIEFAVQDTNANGIGADWHPNIKTNQIMATKFASTLQTDLGW